MASEDFLPEEAQAIMWIVWKRADHGFSKAGKPLDDLKAFLGRSSKTALESKYISIGYSNGQSVVFASPKVRGLVRTWLFDGEDGAGVQMSFLWRSRLRPIFGVE